MAIRFVDRLNTALIPQTNNLGLPEIRTTPERVVLDVAHGVTPSQKPPVRIFLGTEPAQLRAERVFVWSIEQVRDPSRVYEIYFMKDLAGFDRQRWLTGFTNYRFAIPHLAGEIGRAIYNDVDQVYFADPAELFDTEMGNHGLLSISDRDTSVMLLDCARMAPLWPLEVAQHRRRKFLESLARTVPGLWGLIARQWNARDEEYVPHSSKLLHFTVLHTQPWRPFPERYVYYSNPVGHVWLDLERSADDAGYQIFYSTRPSNKYKALREEFLTAASCHHEREEESTEVVSLVKNNREVDGLQKLMETVGAKTILHYRFGKGGVTTSQLEKLEPKGIQPTITQYDPASPSFAKKPSRQFDGVVCDKVLDFLPDEDVPWILEELFGYARRFIYFTVNNFSLRRSLSQQREVRSRPRENSWWLTCIEAASKRHPHVHWKLVSRNKANMDNEGCRSWEGGVRLGGQPKIWILQDNKAGHTIQSIGLAETLGWPFEIKELHFTVLNRLSNHLLGASLMGINKRESAQLSPPWPDLVISTGRRTAPVARWIGEQSQGVTRLVHLGRKGGEIADQFDLVVTCAHFRFPLHPKRLETTAPLNLITSEKFAQAKERWPNLLGGAPPPRVVLVVGGSTRHHRLDTETARRMGEEVRAFAESAGGTAFAVTSPRTGAKASESLIQGLGPSAHVHQWQPGQRDNPYLAYLASADVIVVTGESESMLSEAAASGKPLYIYPLPERPAGFDGRLREWVSARAQARPLNKRGTVRPQRGFNHFCARLIDRGLIRPQRDLKMLHQNLINRGIACMFGEPLQNGARPVLRETHTVACQVRKLLGLNTL